MKNHLPYYLQIKADLSKRILTMQPNERIPSENELMKSYAVSRGTVKQAIIDLVYEGALYRKQGKGTFVSPAKINRSFDHLPSFSSDVIGQGLNPAYKVLFFDTVQAPDAIAEKLGIPKEAPLIRYKRIILVDAQPLIVACSYLRCDLFPDFRQEHIKSSFYDSLMERYHTAPKMAYDTYSVVLASPKTAAHLKVKEGAPLMYSERIAYLQDGTSAEYVESFIRADKYKLSVYVGAGNDRFVSNQIL